MKKQYDRRHRARELPPLEEDTPVFIANGRDSNVVPGRVTGSASDRSYLVETPTGMSRRNRSHSNVRTDGQNDTPLTRENLALIPSECVPPRTPIATRLRTGTTIKPPDKLTF